jgi:hypothetical protein
VSELLEQMKLLNEDHKPDGWPAVRMSDINELIEIIEKKSEQLAKANERARELERDSVSDKVSAIKDAFKYAEIKSKNWFKKQFDTMPIEYRDGIDCMVAFLDEYAEQLRKGQE